MVIDREEAVGEVVDGGREREREEEDGMNEGRREEGKKGRKEENTKSPRLQDSRRPEDLPILKESRTEI